MILSKKSASLTLTSVLISGIYGMGLLAYLPRYLLHHKFEITLIQIILTCFVFTTMIFPPLVGKYSDKLQRRSFFFKIGSIGINFALLILSLTFNLTILVIIIFFYGFFWACDMMKFVLYSELVESDHRLIAYYNAVLAMGWFLGAFLTGIVIDIFGIETYFQFLLIVSLINTCVILFLKENRALILERHEKFNNENRNDLTLTNQRENNKISKSIYPSLFFRNFAVRPIFAIIAILMFYHLPNDTQIGFLIGINFLIQVFLNILLGHIITNKNIKWIMIIGYILSTITIFGWIISTDFWSFLLYQILISLSFAMFSTATQIYISQNTTPKNKGKYLGYMNSSSQLGTFSGGILFTFLLFVYSDYYPAMWFMIIFPTFSALIILIKFDKEHDNN